MEIFMYDYIRIGQAVPKVTVGDVLSNTGEIKKMISALADCDIICFPELCLTGYTCADLFFQDKLLCDAKAAIEEITDLSKNLDSVIIIGSPLKISGQLYNCALVIYGGRLCGIVPKVFLPNYNEFYEKRWFSSGSELSVSETEFVCRNETYNVKTGSDIVFSVNNEFNFAVEVCEDLWAPVSPSSFLCLGGAEVMLNISASNETIAKRDYRRALVGQTSAKNLCAYFYTSAGSGESTTDLIFSGHSIAAENGSIINENKEYIASDYIIKTDADLGKIKAERLKMKVFGDSAALYRKTHPVRTVSLNKKMLSDGTLLKVNKFPFIPANEEKRLERCMNIFTMQTEALKKRMSVTGGKLVVGVSGGLDSTLALLVCAAAAKEAPYDISNVTGVTMPCFGTSDRTYKNAVALMDALGITKREVNIKEACLLHFRDIAHDEADRSVTYENVQARERTQVLMDIANETGAIVVGTGDLSELALGWCTYNADHMSMYGVNSGIPKTLVRWMIDSIAKNDVFFGAGEILKDICDTPISPELLPPDETGKIAQKTEDVVGPYSLHDFFLYYMLRFGYAPSKIYHLAQKAFCGEFDSETILKWLKNFYRRFFTQQFKRSCLPDGVKVGSICLSPRGDWRMPSDASFKIWLDEVNTLK